MSQLRTADAVNIFSAYHNRLATGGKVYEWQDYLNPSTYALTEVVGVSQPLELDEGGKEYIQFTTTGGDVQRLVGAFNNGGLADRYTLVLQLKELEESANINILNLGSELNIGGGSSQMRCRVFGRGQWIEAPYSSHDFTTGEWTFVVIVQNSVTPKMRLYLDGIFQAQYTASSSSVNLTTNDATLGKYDAFGWGNMVQKTEGWALYSVAFSVAEADDAALWDWRILTIPADPTGLTSTPSDTSIALSWTDNATNETSYTVQRSLDNFSSVESTHSLPADSDSYTDDGSDLGALVEGTTYYYRTYCSNAQGDSGFSNIASAEFVGFRYGAPYVLINWFKEYLTGQNYFDCANSMGDKWEFYNVMTKDEKILDGKEWVSRVTNDNTRTPSLWFLQMPTASASRAQKANSGEQNEVFVFDFYAILTASDNTQLEKDFARLYGQVDDCFNRKDLTFDPPVSGDPTNILTQVPFDGDGALLTTIPYTRLVRFPEWHCYPVAKAAIGKNKQALKVKFTVTCNYHTFIS